MSLIKERARILLVEDDEFFRDIVLNTLILHKFQVTVAPDGSVAQQRLTQNSYDLIITDLLTPNLNGLELLKWIRQASPHTKIILMSGHLVEELLPTEDVNLKFLAKPFSGAELLDCIDQLTNT